MSVIPTPFFDALINTMDTIVNLTGSGGFTGGSIEISRAGSLVTISATSAITHASLASVTSAVGIIPSWAIPAISKRNTFESTSSGPFHAVVDINTNGSVTFSYLNASLISAVRTSGGSNFTISYNV